MIYYFAYGSNMDQVQMKERCLDAVLHGRACLKNFRLAFTIYSPVRRCGCADVVVCAGDEVWGLVYQLNEVDLAKLDECEGYPIHYTRQTCSVISDDGQLISAEVYVVVDKSTLLLKPSSDYLGKLIKASQDFDFPQSYQDKILSFADFI